MISEGDSLPELTFLLDNGEEKSFAHFRQRHLVLYFYPKDDTPGCTQEACDLRDNWAVLQKSTNVLGVSRDSQASHTRFRNKFELPFHLIVDSDGVLCECFGTWVEKSMYGKTYWGIERSTFLVDGHGIVRKIWRKVKVPGHIQEILKALEAL